MLPEINFSRFSHSDFVDSWDALLNGAYEVKAAKQEIDYFIEKMEYVYAFILPPISEERELKLYFDEITSYMDLYIDLDKPIYGLPQVSKTDWAENLRKFLRPLTPSEQATEMGKRLMQERLWKYRNQDW